MKEYYVKIKPCCDNCAYQRGVQLGPKEQPRLYCNKWGCKNPLPDERTCSEFEFDNNIVRPSVIRDDYFVRNTDKLEEDI